MQYFSSFLRVRHFGVAELSGSGSESLMRLQTRYWLVLHSSWGWTGSGIPAFTHTANGKNSQFLAGSWLWSSAPYHMGLFIGFLRLASWLLPRETRPVWRGSHSIFDDPAQKCANLLYSICHGHQLWYSVIGDFTRARVPRGRYHWGLLRN